MQLCNNTDSAITPLPTTHSRRSVLRGLGAGLLVGSAGPGLSRAVAQEATPPPLTNFPGETFVGETSVPGLLIAVVLAETDAAAEREARAYFCDGAGIGEWLLGTAAEGTLALSSETGTQLDGQLTETGVTGSATLPDGTSLTFEAVPADGVGGLYTFTTFLDYRVKGASSTGGGLEGVLADRPITTPEGAAYLATGILTPAAGEPVVVALLASDLSGESSGRLLVLNGAAGATGRSRREADDSDDGGGTYVDWHNL